MTTPSKKLPQRGFYYHYKHDPTGSVGNYAYEILGVGHHTEDDCDERDQFMQVYRPLYKDAYVYRNGKMFDLRPLAMAMEEVEAGCVKMPRFRRITDPAVIAQLEAIKQEMYG